MATTTGPREAAGSSGAGLRLPLHAFHAGDQRPMQIEPAPRRRAWIEAMPEHWANRCLPLVVANEAGWVIRNPVGFTATWAGGDGVDSLTLQPLRAGQTLPVTSIFGFGIVTWAIPYLFRTPPGYNLLVRGPANWPKDAASPLEGLVETDWSVATFTMNWKLTRASAPVVFGAGEPFCMIVPQRRHELEAFEPRTRPLEAEPDLRRAEKVWAKRRHDLVVRKFLAQYSPELAADRREWQGDYYRGAAPAGAAAPDHQKHLCLSPFIATNA
jgi:hypothetical protein